jgi:hypothetical protein
MSSWFSARPHTDAVATLVAKLKLLRQNAKYWKKTLKPDCAHLDIAKKTLELMDWIEEERPLTHLETIFRNIVKKRIVLLIHMIAISARQIGKVTWCTLGDEDTRFYHARASAQLRVKKIKLLEDGGVEV